MFTFENRGRCPVTVCPEKVSKPHLPELFISCLLNKPPWRLIHTPKVCTDFCSLLRA